MTRLVVSSDLGADKYTIHRYGAKMVIDKAEALRLIQDLMFMVKASETDRVVQAQIKQLEGAYK